MLIPLWFLNEEIVVHRIFFKEGILLIQPSVECNVDRRDNEIIINSNCFSILQFTDINKEKLKYVNKQKLLLEKLMQVNLSNILVSNKLALINQKRREETFLLLLFRQEKIGIYLYAWVANLVKELNPVNIDFKNYVTAGCLFGSSLKAKDKYTGVSFPLICLDFDFFADKLVDNIFIMGNITSLYETVLFNELSRFAKLIQSFPSQNRKTLFYHLPYYDYIIFVAMLLIQGKVTYKAFCDFYQLILDKSTVYIRKIMEIFQQSTIDIIIESPYQNIFGHLENRSLYTADALLDKLDIDLRSIKYDLVYEAQDKEEKQFIQCCWKKLLQNTLDTQHQEIWQYLSKIYNNDAPITLKDLLERANAMMIARASWGQEHFETCSVLPYSEKQIQIGYSKILKKDSDKVLREVVNLTIFDPVVVYSNNKNAGLFHCDYAIGQVEALIQSSRRNLFFFGQKSPIECEEVENVSSIARNLAH
jgi:uncharacterized protein (DUF486 family)